MMSDEMSSFELNVAIAKAQGYRMDIVTVQHHGTFWQITFPDERTRWVCDKDKHEKYAWGRALEDGWIADHANDANEALELVASRDDFRLSRDGNEWAVVIGNQWDDHATIYSYRHEEAAYAISRAWLSWITAQVSA